MVPGSLACASCLHHANSGPIVLAACRFNLALGVHRLLHAAVLGTKAEHKKEVAEFLAEDYANHKELATVVGKSVVGLLSSCYCGW